MIYIIISAELLNSHQLVKSLRQHQLHSDLSKGAGGKMLHINSASAGLFNHSYIINLTSVTCTIYGKQMRDFTCCSDLCLHQERTRPINKIVWETFTAVILIMHFKSWGYQKNGFFFSILFDS